jgi:shikimate 5-dehydrogenase
VAFPPIRGSWDVLVNATTATTLGAGNPGSERPIIDEDLLAEGSVVYDLVYWPPVTPLMAAAARAGCRTLGGLPMLVEQAERQFEWWTRERPAPGLFDAAARRGLERMNQ